MLCSILIIFKWGYMKKRIYTINITNLLLNPDILKLGIGYIGDCQSENKNLYSTLGIELFAHEVLKVYLGIYNSWDDIDMPSDDLKILYGKFYLLFVIHVPEVCKYKNNIISKVSILDTQMHIILSHNKNISQTELGTICC